MPILGHDFSKFPKSELICFSIVSFSQKFIHKWPSRFQRDQFESAHKWTNEEFRMFYNVMVRGIKLEDNRTWIIIIGRKKMLRSVNGRHFCTMGLERVNEQYRVIPIRKKIRMILNSTIFEEFTIQKFAATTRISLSPSLISTAMIDFDSVSVR